MLEEIKNKLNVNDFKIAKEAQVKYEAENITKKEIERSLEIGKKFGIRYINATLDNYIAETKEQERVLSSIRAYIVYCDDKSLVFIGNHGTGKNHLATCVGRYYLDQGKTIEVVTAYFLFAKLKESWTIAKETELILFYSKVGLLVIDEIGRTFGSQTELNFLGEILNKRYNNKKPFLLISNIAEKEEADKFIGSQIDSRLSQMADIYYFTWDDWRKKKLEG
jgi:DNA replication protein DnaC